MNKLIFIWIVIASPLIAEEDIELGGAAASKEAPPAPKKDPCGSPQAALTTTLSRKIDRISCFEKDDYSDHELFLVADRLVAVLDAHNINIDVKRVTADPNYQDPEAASGQYLLSPELPSIYLTKTGNQWLFSEDTIKSIDELYKATLHFNIKSLYEWAPPWAQKEILGITGINLLQIALLIILFVVSFLLRFGVAFLSAQVLGIFQRRLNLTEREDKLRNAAYAVGNLVVAAFLGIVVPGLDFSAHVTHFLILAIRLYAGIAIVVLAYRCVDLFSHLIYRRKVDAERTLDNQLILLMEKVVKTAVCIVGAYFILQSIDVDVTGFLAGITIGGLALSFAAKDTVANLFGSLTIFTDRPFRLGDEIKIEDVEGKVEDVGFRSTQIRTFAGTLVSIPNSKFTDSLVENTSARKSRKTKAEIFVTYDTTPDQIEAFCNGVRAIIKSHPQTRKDKYDVHFSGFGESALKISISFFIFAKGDSEENRSRHEIYLDIWRLAEKMGVQFAYPIHDFHLHSEQLRAVQPKPSQEALTDAANFFAPSGKGVIPPGPRMGEGYFPEKPTKPATKPKKLKL